MSISPSFDTGALRIRLKTAEDKVKAFDISVSGSYVHSSPLHSPDSYICLFPNAQCHSFWLQHLRVVWNLHLHSGSGGPSAIICTA